MLIDYNIINKYMNENRRNNIMNNLRDIINNYNNSNQLYHLNMYDYNRNINSLIRLLDQLSNTPSRTSTNRFGGIRENINNRRSSFLDDDYYNSILFRLTTQLNTSLNSPQSTGLTSDQIQQYTQIIQYTSVLSEPRCYITHEQFVENEDVCQIIHCGHYFKPNSIKRWLENNTTCPVCRYDLTSQPTNNNTSIDISNNLQDSLPPLQPVNNELSSMPLNSQNLNQISSFFSSIDTSNNLAYSFDIPLYFPPPRNNNL